MALRGASNGSDRLSEHFRASEFRCRCLDKGLRSAEFCGGNIAPEGVDPALIEGLEILRAELGGRPIYVTSAYRCPAYNRKIGGAPKSYHVTGKAADIVVSGVDYLEVMRVIERLGIFTGRGLYPDGHFVHVDTRFGLRGSPVVRWVRENGIYRTVASFVQYL